MALKFGKRTLFIALFTVFATLCMALAICFLLPSSRTASAIDNNHTHDDTWKALTADSVSTTGTVELSTSGNYYLNVETLNANITITSKATVVLCLNGKTLQAYNSGQSVITVSEGASFTLCECSSQKIGKVTGADISNSYGGGVYVDRKATFTMYGGEIDSNTAIRGGGVYVNEGSFIMEGGTIDTNIANGYSNEDGGGGVYVSAGSFIMRGGTISNNIAEDYGGGVYVNGGVFTMSGGTIGSLNVTDEAGGGVYVNGGTFTMTGGNIIGNQADYGGGVFVYSSKFIMSGGSIIGNEAAYFGGGVSVYSNENNAVIGEFTMTGGTISDNTVIDNNSVNRGGGVFVNERSKFTMSGGEISDNTAAYGGGVFVDANGTFTMQSVTNNGTTTSGIISGNMASDGGGVFVYGSSSEGVGTFIMSDGMIGGPVTVNGTLISGNAATNVGGGVGVYGGKFEMSGGVIIDNTASNNPDDSSSSSSDDTTTTTKGGGVYVSNSGTFTMTGGTIISNTADHGGGVYVTISSKFIMKYATSTTTSGTITGNTADYGGGVYIYGGTFTMNGGTIGGVIDGTEITGNTSNSNGGGVYVGLYGTFTMTGGSIIGNTADYGGGVYVIKNGQFTMTGGTITENEADYGGGGVDVYGGAFTMDHGEISNNKARIGGGVDVILSGTVDMAGGTITENEADYGGGVFVGNGTFTMTVSTISSGTITGNTASNVGGGVYVYVGTFTMKSGIITGNKATSNSSGNTECNGGGVYVAGTSDTQQGIFTMNGGTITNNTADNKGGGVFVNKNGKFTMTGGYIANNQVTSKENIQGSGYGGGVCVCDGSFVMQGGTIGCTVDGITTIKGNTARLGGGVSVISSGTFEMSGGTITGNTAILGGGVYVGNGTFTMTGGTIGGTVNGTTITGNTAILGGGVYVNKGTFTMTTGTTTSGTTSGTITGNTASNSSVNAECNGGGVYVVGTSDKQGTFTMSGGTITNNTATTKGSGVYISSYGVFTINDGATVTGNTNNADVYNDGGMYEKNGGTVGNSSGTTLSDSASTDTSSEKGEYTISNITVTYGESYTVKVSGTYVDVDVIYAYDDYIGYELPTEAGTYEVTATIYAVLNDGSVNTSTVTFTIAILQKDLAEDMFSITGTYIYNGTEQKAEYTYADTDKDNAVLTENDFDVTYSYNTSAGTATVTFTGKGNYSGSVTLTYEIEKADYDASGLSLTSKTVTYNGSAQVLEITGTLPTGVTVTYYYEGTNGTTYEKTTVAPTNAGYYTVTAVFSGDENYNAISSLTADLTIEKASYDTSSLTLEDVTVTYNGEAQAVAVSGLPTGVEVTYYYMGAYSTVYEKSTVAPTEAGIYFVTAVFSGDFDNYNAISKLTSTLTIEKATVTEKAVQTFNITAHVGDSLEDIELPEGWTWSDTATFTSSGEYIVYATYTADDNYETVTAAVTVSVTGYSSSDKLSIAAIVICCAAFAVGASVLAVFFLKKKKV